MYAIVNEPHEAPEPTVDLSTVCDAPSRLKADREVFGALYVQYLDPIYRYCYRRLGSREDAEDATSEAFCKAFAAFARYHDQSFGCWIFTIAHHVVVDACRRRRSHQPLEAADHVVEPDRSPEEVAIDAEQCQRMAELIHHLPSTERAIVQLRVAGLTHAEIGVVLGRTTGSVKALHHRARTRLRKLVAARTGAAAEYDDSLRQDRRPSLP